MAPLIFHPINRFEVRFKTLQDLFQTVLLTEFILEFSLGIFYEFV